jgi:hypothetical protein
MWENLTLVLWEFGQNPKIKLPTHENFLFGKQCTSLPIKKYLHPVVHFHSDWIWFRLMLNQIQSPWRWRQYIPLKRKSMHLPNSAWIQKRAIICTQSSVCSLYPITCPKIKHWSAPQMGQVMLYGFLQYPSKGSHLDLLTADLMKPYYYYCMALRWVRWIGSKTGDAWMPSYKKTTTAWWDDKHDVFVNRRKTG